MGAFFAKAGLTSLDASPSRYTLQALRALQNARQDRICGVGEERGFLDENHVPPKDTHIYIYIYILDAHMYTHIDIHIYIYIMYRNISFM